MTKPTSFIHPELGEIIGYSSLVEFEEACEAWDAANPGNPLVDLEVEDWDD